MIRKLLAYAKQPECRIRRQETTKPAMAAALGVFKCALVTVLLAVISDLLRF